MDFTLKIYTRLLKTILKSGYSIQTFEEFILNPQKKTVVLRHDVDRQPNNALRMAKIENKFGITASYYFRIVPYVFKENLIKKCVILGHEVSYHYEDMTLFKGNIDKSYMHFKRKLDLFRTFYPAKTVCMHGSPITKWDNRDIWKKYDYKKLDIIGEPYFDVDYKKVFYITDTGRRWNKEDISVRDKVNSGFNYKINSTIDLINKFENDELPNQVIINTHPHRWVNNFGSWVKELVLQNIKNVVKYLIIKFR